MTRQQLDNIVLPFTINNAGAIGRLVRVGSVVNSILERHNYPESVSVVLGELIAFASGLSTSLKYKGVLTVEIKGDGPVPLMVVDITSEGNIRGYAKIERNIPEYEKIKDTIIPALFGKGHMMYTIDQSNGGQRYQGIVGLERNTLEECSVQYFEQSAQFYSVFRLACEKTKNGWRAGSITLQRMPSEAQKRDIVQEQNSWEHVSILLKSTKSQELTDEILSGEELLLRLYHEDGVKIFNTLALKDTCRCSREKMIAVIKSLAQSEIESVLTEKGKIEIHCEYCNTTKEFSHEDIGIKPS